MPRSDARKSRSEFRRFFVKGLAVLLPTVLTLWILVKAYEFIDVTIAQPINGGIRFAMGQATPHIPLFEQSFEPTDATVNKEILKRESEGKTNISKAKVQSELREERILEWWQARWYMNFIGIVVAILAVYIAGRLLGGFLGRRIYSRLEALLTSIPLIKQVYPYVKQVVDFVISDDKPIRFNRVVLVEYPRKGIWSIGLMTGTPMTAIQDHISDSVGPGITVFIPSSPTPFTGYTIMVPRDTVIELPISIDEALRFTISGGVLVPSHQSSGSSEPGPLPQPSTPGEDDSHTSEQE